MMAAIQIEMLAVPAPYSAAEIKVGRFPVPPDFSPKLHVFLTALLNAAGAGETSDVFLQNEYLANARGAFNAHLPEWVPQVGLGVWPDRPPPELWKISDLFRMARGEKIPLMYQVSHPTAGPKANSQAFDLLLGSGMVIVVVHPGSTNDLLAQYKDTYLPNIKQQNLRIMPFYVPLLDHNSLQKRQSGDLQKWLGSARLYLRESPAENTILLVTDSDLGALLTGAGAKKQGDRWTVE